MGVWKRVAAKFETKKLMSGIFKVLNIKKIVLNFAQTSVNFPIHDFCLLKRKFLAVFSLKKEKLRVFLNCFAQRFCRKEG